MDVSKELAEAAKLSRERHKVYAGKRDSHALHARLMELLFPDLSSRSGAGAARINPERVAILHFITAKLARYSISLDAGKPHMDSIRDSIVYWAMLERIESEVAPNEGVHVTMTPELFEKYKKWMGCIELK